MALILLVAFNIWASVFTLNDQVNFVRFLQNSTPLLLGLYLAMDEIGTKYTKKDISPFLELMVIRQLQQSTKV